MSDPIGPGDTVECIDASPYEDGPAVLVLGQRYVVRAVWDYLPHRGNPCSEWIDCAVDLVDVPDPAEGLAWGLYRFRPLGGPTSDLLKNLLQPSRARELLEA